MDINTKLLDLLGETIECIAVDNTVEDAAMNNYLKTFGCSEDGYFKSHGIEILHGLDYFTHITLEDYAAKDSAYGEFVESIDSLDDNMREKASDYEKLLDELTERKDSESLEQLIKLLREVKSTWSIADGIIDTMKKGDGILRALVYIEIGYIYGIHSVLIEDIKETIEEKENELKGKNEYKVCNKVIDEVIQQYRIKLLDNGHFGFKKNNNMQSFKFKLSIHGEKSLFSEKFIACKSIFLEKEYTDFSKGNTGILATNLGVIGRTVKVDRDLNVESDIQFFVSWETLSQQDSIYAINGVRFGKNLVDMEQKHAVELIRFYDVILKNIKGVFDSESSVIAKVKNEKSGEVETQIDVSKIDIMPDTTPIDDEESPKLWAYFASIVIYGILAKIQSENLLVKIFEVLFMLSLFYFPYEFFKYKKWGAMIISIITTLLVFGI